MKTKLFRIRFVVCLATVLLILGLVGACAEPAPSPAPPAPAPAPAPKPPAPAPAPAPKPPAPEKPIEIILSHATPEPAGICQVAKQWGDLIEERTGGRVKFTYYWAGSLMPSSEFVGGLQAGAMDIGYVVHPAPNYFPLNFYTIYQTFMGYPSMRAGTEIYHELYDKFPAMQDEFKGFVQLTARLTPPGQIHTSEKIVKVPSDLKGMKIAFTAGSQFAQIVEEQGGAPVSMHPADVSMSITTGVVEGWFDHFPVALVFGALPDLPYHTIFGEGGTQMMPEFFLMTEKRLKEFSPDIQKIFIDSGAWYEDEALKIDDSEIQRAMDTATEMNHTFTYLTEAEIETWMSAAAPLHQQWIDEWEAKGIPAQDIYDEAKRLIAAYK